MRGRRRYSLTWLSSYSSAENKCHRSKSFSGIHVNTGSWKWNGLLPLKDSPAIAGFNSLSIEIESSSSPGFITTKNQTRDEMKTGAETLGAFDFTLQLSDGVNV